jgi:hypothetical protein
MPDAVREINNGWKSDRLVASVVLSQALGQFVCSLTGWNGSRIGQGGDWQQP